MYFGYATGPSSYLHRTSYRQARRERTTEESVGINKEMIVARRSPGGKVAEQEGSIANELRDTPILKTPVGKITSDDEWNLALGKFLDGDLKCICFTVKGNKNGGVHTVSLVSTPRKCKC
jgi:hypothetical protein